ncbi:MAG: DNA mismatch repair endonuclease MutH [Gammaproteobacteria bacterium]|nr:DNA mismatch repair endonuclease MutH [Gammaproteobacteria bacterium]
MPSRNPIPPRTEAELLASAARLAGRSLGQVAAQLGVPVPTDRRRMKGWAGRLLERYLGANAASLPEPDFRELGIELKTVPVNARGRPAESTYVCTVPLASDHGKWETCLVRRKLARVLWLPVEGEPSIPVPVRRIGTALLWVPSPVQEQTLRADWEELTGMIALGELERLSARHGRALQIRPKAADARSLTRTFDSNGAPGSTLPRGFYLRAAFTARILAGPTHDSAS